MNRMGSWGRLMFVQTRTSGKADATVPAKRLQSASFVLPNRRMDAMGPHTCISAPMDAMGSHVRTVPTTGMDAIRPCTQSQPATTSYQLTTGGRYPSTHLMSTHARMDAIRPFISNLRVPKLKEKVCYN